MSVFRRCGDVDWILIELRMMVWAGATAGGKSYATVGRIFSGDKNN